MKITVPVDGAAEAGPLIAAGADELFCGVQHPGWAAVSGTPNMRAAPEASLRSFEELAGVVRAASGRGVPVHLALNSGYPFKAAFMEALADAARACAAGVSGFIASDIALIRELKRKFPGKSVILSTSGNCFNSETAAYFGGLGLDRLVLPRDLSLEELGRLCASIRAKGVGIPLEFFVQNITCRNVNRYCRYHAQLPMRRSRSPLSPAARRIAGFLSVNFPGLYLKYRSALAGPGRGQPEETPCLIPYKAVFASRADGSRETVEEFYIGDGRGLSCAACGLFFFAGTGIEYLKIIGRGYPLEKKISDVKFIAAVRGALSAGPGSFGEFSARARELRLRAYGAGCRRTECHFPEFVRDNTAGGKDGR